MYEEGDVLFHTGAGLTRFHVKRRNLPVWTAPGDGLAGRAELAVLVNPQRGKLCGELGGQRGLPVVDGQYAAWFGAFHVKLSGGA